MLGRQTKVVLIGGRWSEAHWQRCTGQRALRRQTKVVLIGGS